MVLEGTNGNTSNLPPAARNVSALTNLVLSNIYLHSERDGTVTPAAKYIACKLQLSFSSSSSSNADGFLRGEHPTRKKEREGEL